MGEILWSYSTNMTDAEWAIIELLRLTESNDIKEIYSMFFFIN